MGDLKYVSIDRVFSKLGRELKGTDLNETDVIEWIGDALSFLEVPQILVEDVKFLKVKDYHTDMPDCLHMITQIAKNLDVPKPKELPCEETEPEVPEEKEDTCYSCESGGDVTPFNKVNINADYLDHLPDEYALAFLNLEEAQLLECQDLEKLDLDWTYRAWTSSAYYRRNFAPVRLSNHTFFNSLVCREKDPIYTSHDYEYTVIGEREKRIRFNFKEGEVAISYLKVSVDEETGYPLIPDNISYISAIVYFIKWKLAESFEWSGREGWAGKADKAEERWLKYARQAKNNMKMPKTLDQYQNLLEQSHYLIPNHKRYYDYFGNLGKSSMRNFQVQNNNHNIR